MTNAGLGLLDNVADSLTRLAYLEKKSHDDDEMLALLIKQKDDIAQELADNKHNSGVELYRLEQERDAAVKVAREVKAIIETGSAMMLSGLRKMAGEATPEKLPVAPLAARDDERLPHLSPHLKAAPRQLPPSDLLPPNEFGHRLADVPYAPRDRERQPIPRLGEAR